MVRAFSGAQALSASPLTRLPGNPSIQAEVERRITAGSPFALIHADIHRFKAFNDAYGYARGDLSIRETALIIGAALSRAEDPGGFLGHVGGDDFAASARSGRCRAGLDRALGPPR